MIRIIKKRLLIFIFIGIFASWAGLLYYYPPTELVEILGIRNGYLAGFTAAFLAGISTFTTVPYSLLIFTLGAGGLNPFILGFVTGLGITMGDTVSYFLGYHGREVLSSRLQSVFERFFRWCSLRPKLIPLGLFLYGALVPFTNDLVVISMGLARYPYWRLMVPLGLGNMVFNTGAALAGAYGFSLVF